MKTTENFPSRVGVGRPARADGRIDRVCGQTGALFEPQKRAGCIFSSEVKNRKQKGEEMKSLMLKTIVTALAVAVGVLTMPIWPVVFAAVIWNSLDDDEDGE